MKDAFFEYYKTDEIAVKNIWKNCIFSFDANVILNLYRYTENTRNKFFEILKNIQKDLILTHQAGFEYHKNRLSTINSQHKAYDNLTEFFSKKSNEIENELNNYKKHSYLEISNISEKINSTFDKISKDISQLKENHPELINEDEIRDSITEIFSGHITLPYDNNRLNQIYKDGKIRYENNIPPGYKDFKQKKDCDDNSLYGDFIIWHQVIDHAKDAKKPLIFVTDDLKEDWWFKFNGKTISPRPELIKEFYEKSGQKILIYNADSFLSFAKDQMGADIDDSILDEIKNLRLKDEKYLYSQNLNKLKTLYKQHGIESKNKYDRDLFETYIKSESNNPEYLNVYKTFLKYYVNENLNSKDSNQVFSEKKKLYKILKASENLSDEKKQILLNFLINYKRDFLDDDFETSA